MSRLTFWNNVTPLQRRAIVLVGISFIVGFFLSGRSTSPGRSISRDDVWAVSWQTLAVGGDHPFRIQMPGAPRHLVQDVVLQPLGVTVRKGVFVSEDSRGRQYVLAVAQYPKHTPPFAPEQIVQAELQTLFLNTSDFAIDVSTSATGAEFFARRFDGGASVRGTVRIDGTSVYVLSFSALPALLSDTFYHQFVTSFTL